MATQVEFDPAEDTAAKQRTKPAERALTGRPEPTKSSEDGFRLDQVAESTLVADAAGDFVDLKMDKAARRNAMRKNWAGGLDLPSVIWLVGLHLGALAAPFFFTWKSVGLLAVLSWLTGMWGITLTFHRLLTHGSFKTYRPVKWFLAWLGGLAGEGPALTWVAVHRKHHKFSDMPGDPHSPRDGAWWSHMLWLAPKYTEAYKKELHERYAPDLARDPVIRFLDTTFLLWHFLLGGALFAIGYFGWDLYTAMSFLTWGMFLRLIYVLHVTWFVNSATHMWGYRNYETTDDSRNLWWVGLLAFGEGWHNNHHAFQRMAKHGHKWWEFDITYLTILALEKVGLIWGVVHDVPARAKSLEKPAT